MNESTANPMKMRHGIGAKVLLAVGVAAAAGLLTLGLFYNFAQERSIRAQNEQRMRDVTATTIQAVESMMLAGHAEVMHEFARRLRSKAGVEGFDIMRPDGSAAFLDNKTLNAVNERLGGQSFQPRAEEAQKAVLRGDDPHLSEALRSRASQVYYADNAAGEQSLVFLDPLVNKERCQVCHGAASPVLGVVMIATSLEPVRRDIRATRATSLLILALAMLVILLITSQLVKRNVVRRVRKITEGMARVAAGNLDEQVSERGRDELSEMARSFNAMTRGLLESYEGLHQEQNKLQTVIRSAREGAVVTDGSGAIKIVNASAEQLLGKSAERIVADGFLRLFDDPEQMKSWLDAPIEAAVETEYQGRILLVNAATIRAESGQVLGSAALIRDVTSERKIAAELNRISLTDELTGLWNRRHLDQTIAREWERAQRYRRSFGVVMIDIDHFKRFNDEHGHEQGDRVLRAVGQAVAASVRGADIACRYGGEELTVVLPESDERAALLVAERIRRAVEALRVDGLAVTISLGVAAYPDAAVASAADLVKGADAALYAAKQGGRNRVESFVGGGTPPAAA